MQKKSKPLEYEFACIFRKIRKKLHFKLEVVDKLENHLLEFLVQAATSKCIEFNIEANKTHKKEDSAFLLMSNLRGICEDLIYLTYLSRLEKDDADKLIEIKLEKNCYEGLSRQRMFFESNNPMQPVLGNSNCLELFERKKNEYRDFWRSINHFQGKVPKVSQLAEYQGLKSTYEFIYFAASNFVHFNPHALFRTGWSCSIKGPYIFSIRNMNGYYRSFSTVYGAVLFIGFHASFSKKYLNESLDAEVNELIELIRNITRWPEVITFEEMNVKAPFNLFTSALIKAKKEKEEKVLHSDILREVQGLGRKIGIP